MLIIVTGAIGIGKTTVCRNLIETIRDRGYSCGGILTCKAADKSIIVEDIQSEEKKTLASIKPEYQGPSTAKYFFNPRGIDFGAQVLDKATSTAVLIVDEIGYLELRGGGFISIFESIKAGRIKDCILVIRKELLSAFRPQFPTIPLVFETTVSNRDRLHQEIVSVLFGKLPRKKAS